jgi:hypothetical protein
MRFLSYLVTVLFSAFLAACGGGGGSPGTTAGATALFTTAPTALTMTLGNTQAFTVGGGRGPYTVNSSDSSVVAAGLSGTDLTLGAVADGSATITVRDAAGATTAVTVTTKDVPVVTNAPPSVTIGIGTAAAQSYQITGGIGGFTAVSDNPTVVSVSMVGSKLTITGLKAGTANVIALDVNRHGVTIAVTVTGGLDLFTTAAPGVTIANGTSASYLVGGGLAPYVASSANTSVATVSLDPTTDMLTISGVGTGGTTVTLRDTAGKVVTVAVTVAPATSLFTTAPSPLTIPVGVATFTVGGGVAPYTVSSSNLAVATASVSGTSLSITGISKGAAAIVVRDNVGATVNISTTVSGGADLFTTAPAGGVTLSVGSTASYSIGGGIGPYTVTSSNTSAAKVLDARANPFTLQGVAVGTANVVVRDSAGSIVNLAVTVSNTQLTLNPTTAHTIIGLTNYTVIIGGVGPFTAISTFPSAVTVSVGTLNSATGVFTADPNGNIVKMIANQAVDPAQIVVTDSQGNSANFSLTATAGQPSMTFAPSTLQIGEGFSGNITLLLYGATGTTNVFTTFPGLISVVTTPVTGNGSQPATVTVHAIGGGICATGAVTITAIDSTGASATSDITIVDNVGNNIALGCP